MTNVMCDNPMQVMLTLLSVPETRDLSYTTGLATNADLLRLFCGKRTAHATGQH